MQSAAALTAGIPLALLLTLPAAAQLADTERLPGFLNGIAAGSLNDLDGDGLADVVFLGRHPQPLGLDTALYAMFADGQGGYGQAVPVVVIPGAFAQDSRYLLDDLDADGDLDLVFAGWAGVQPTRIMQYEADGAGGQTLVQSFDGPNGEPGRMQRIDVNGDGLVDLHFDGDLRGAGFIPATPGGWASFQAYFSGTISHGAIRPGDLDGDGDADLLVGRSTDIGQGPGVCSLFENVGSFPLDLQDGVAITDYVQFLELTDLDADGDLDAVITPGFSNDLAVLENNAGSFGAPLLVASDLAGTAEVQLVDIDSDGDQDVLTRPLLGWRIHENTGTIGLGSTSVLGPIFYRPTDFADLDGDGLQDALFLRSDTQINYLGIGMVSAPFGTFEIAAPLNRLTEQPGRSNPVVIDADANGMDDLLFVDSYSDFGRSFLSLKRATGGGSYGLGVELDNLPADTLDPVTGDFDGDGDDDILLSPGGSFELVLYRGDGTGSFSPAEFAAALPSLPAQVLAADMNSDGIADVIVTRAGSTAVSYALGSASGQFGAFKNVTGNFATAVTPVPADMNADGRMDLLFSTGSVVELALQSASGAFPSRSVVVDATGLPGTFNGLRPPIAQDTDGDGIADIVVLVHNTVRSAPGLGSGAFGPLQLLLAEGGSAYRELFASPVNPDPQADLILMRDQFVSAPLWSESLGGGTFGPTQGVTGQDLPIARNMLLADADGDGDQDLISGTYEGSYLLTRNDSVGPLGTNYCSPAVPNSTGEPGTIRAVGSTDLNFNQFVLFADQLPTQQFGMFLAGPTQGLTTDVTGSEGTLCLQGSIGRFNGPGQLQSTGLTGSIQLTVDLAALPTPGASVAVLTGQTWNFQTWHRDTTLGGLPTSNFTDGLSVGF